jgi:hypothetical protein
LPDWGATASVLASRGPNCQDAENRICATIFPMMLVCQQPHYLPWLGYFDLFVKADAFVILDSAQWIRQGRQHRTRIMGPRGEPQWLTIPVLGHGHRELQLKDMEVDASQAWAAKHWKTIQAAYGKAPHFRSQVEPILRPYFEKMQEEKFLLDIVQAGLWLFWDTFELSCELHWSSEMKEAEGKSERLVSLCQALGANEYYSSLGSTRYLDLSVFRASGIRVRWQHFNATFPNDVKRPLDLSVLDWIAHFPIEEAKRALRPAPRGFEAYLSAEL